MYEVNPNFKMKVSKNKKNNLTQDNWSKSENQKFDSEHGTPLKSPFEITPPPSFWEANIPFSEEIFRKKDSRK